MSCSFCGSNLVALGMSDEDGQEKTEEPSQRRIEKALEEGQILSAKEVFVFTSVLAGLAAILALGLILPSLFDSWRGYLQIIDKESLEDLIKAYGTRAITDFAILSLAVAVPVLIATIFTQAAVGGLHFVAKNLEFKGSRIDPLAGLKRILSVHGLMELLKAILKVCALSAVAGLLLWHSLPSTLVLVDASLHFAMAKILDDFIVLMSASLAVLAVVAVLDYVYSHTSYMKKLRMSRQDIKDEFKDTEGSPEIKARIRRVQMEASRRASRAAAAVDEVGQATAIITNPTHFAVALRYTPGDAGAPKIIAMGRGKLAEKIIEKGRISGVTVFSSPLLARALYFTGDIGVEINDRLYGAVATVLAYIYRLDRGEIVSEPDVIIPEDLMFTPDGRPLSDRERKDVP